MGDKHIPFENHPDGCLCARCKSTYKVPGELNKTNIIDHIIAVGEVLEELSKKPPVPSEGRYFLIESIDTILFTCPIRKCGGHPCGGILAPGVAIEQTFSGEGDFGPDDDGTMSPGGPGKLIQVAKCPRCGASFKL